MPWLARAPFLFGHEDKNEDDGHAQENQRPAPPAGFSTPLAPGANAGEINIFDLPQAARRSDFTNRLAWQAVPGGRQGLVW